MDYAENMNLSFHIISYYTGCGVFDVLLSGKVRYRMKEIFWTS